MRRLGAMTNLYNIIIIHGENFIVTSDCRARQSGKLIPVGLFLFPIAPDRPRFQQNTITRPFVADCRLSIFSNKKNNNNIFPHAKILFRRSFIYLYYVQRGYTSVLKIRNLTATYMYLLYIILFHMGLLYSSTVRSRAKNVFYFSSSSLYFIKFYHIFRRL